MPNKTEIHRLGLAVSRKVSKKAVERNRIKRQVRESFRHFNRAAHPVSHSAPLYMDFVVVAKPSAATVENSLIRAELDRIWPRAIRELQGKSRVSRQVGE